MKIHFGLNGQIIETSNTVASRSDIPLFELFKSFETHRKFSPTQIQLPENLFLRAPENGIVLSTSGTEGERKWIFHSWACLKSRVDSQEAPRKNNAIFLSFEHAAGIEMIFRHYVYEIDFGFYPPSCSPLEAYKALKTQKAQSLSLTPSTFLRFLNYPLLKKWMQENLKALSFGGEEISNELIHILKKDFFSIEVQSVYGTTESWSVKTKAGESLQWHLGEDDKVEVLFKDRKLCLRSPYLFTHFWNGSEFIERLGDVWESEDIVETNSVGAFRFKRPMNNKYHGLKIFPEEWIGHLLQMFDLSWMQIKKNQDGFTGIIPEDKKELIIKLEEEVRKKSWPVLNWIYQSGPETSFRGKQCIQPTELVSGRKLKDLLPKHVMPLSYLEEATWTDHAQFHVITRMNGTVFYLDYFDRKLLQYSVPDFETLLNLIKEIDQPNLQIKLPAVFELDSDLWEELGTYRSWALDLENWGVSYNIHKPWGELYPSLEKRFDRLLDGPEARILSTLSDTTGVYGKDQQGEGLCSFRIVEGIYHGIYLTNRGLSHLQFLRLCAQGLLKAKQEGVKRAQSAVETSHKGAEFLHESLGFKVLPEIYKIWKRKGI